MNQISILLATSFLLIQLRAVHECGKQRAASKPGEGKGRQYSSYGVLLSEPQVHRNFQMQFSNSCWLFCLPRDLWTRSRDRDLISSTITQLCLFNIYILRISSSSHWSLRSSCQYLALAALRLTQSYNAYPNRCATMRCICYMLWTNRDKEAFYAQPRPNAMDMLFEIMVRWPRCQHVISLCNRDHTGFLRTQRTTLITAALIHRHLGRHLCMTDTCHLRSSVQ